MRVNQYTDIPLSLYIASEDTTNTDDEYLPKWVDRNQAEKENVARILVPEAKIDNLQQNSKEITFNYSSPKEVKLTLNHMYFPGIEFFIDTQKFNINKSGSGSIEASVPAGVHAARLLYRSTDIMNYGNLITILSALILLVLCMRISKHTKKSI